MQICRLVAYFVMTPPPRTELLMDEVSISEYTVVDWSSFLREVFFDLALNSPHAGKIGGEGKVVEIDEAKFGKSKYNRGRVIEGQWIFGGFERGSKKIFLVPVPDRTADTLIKCIKEKIAPNTHC